MKNRAAKIQFLLLVGNVFLRKIGATTFPKHCRVWAFDVLEKRLQVVLFFIFFFELVKISFTIVFKIFKFYKADKFFDTISFKTSEFWIHIQRIFQYVVKCIYLQRNEHIPQSFAEREMAVNQSFF